MPPSGLAPVVISVEDPSSADAQWCLGNYFAELAERFEEPFEANRTLPADAGELVPPAVRLYTNRSLAEAKAMYRAHGYVEIPRYSDDPYANHWFEKRLSQQTG